MAHLLSIGSLTSLELVCKPVDTFLHRGHLVTEVCDQSFAGLGLVGTCSSISSVIADHLVELVHRRQGSANSGGDTLCAPRLYLAFGKWRIDKFVWVVAVHERFKRGNVCH